MQREVCEFQRIINETNMIFLLNLLISIVCVCAFDTKLYEKTQQLDAKVSLACDACQCTRGCTVCLIVSYSNANNVQVSLHWTIDGEMLRFGLIAEVRRHSGLYCLAEGGRVDKLIVMNRLTHLFHLVSSIFYAL